MKETSNGTIKNQNIFEMKTTSNGRLTQNIKSGISQQQLMGFSSNFKFKLRGPNQS
jgi:hypothetical protein